MGGAEPAGYGGLLLYDPFDSEAVVEAAAAIELVEWLRGPWPRGLARTLLQGRVPDAIRLRTARGMQSADAWWHMRNSGRRHREEVALPRDTPPINGWIDIDSVPRLATSLRHLTGSAADGVDPPVPIAGAHPRPG